MIHIASHSLVTTIQDLGRVGYQKYGINVSGAMDPLSLRAANLLVGNEEGAGAIEMTLIGPDMTFEEDTLLALTGADLSPNIKGIPVPMYRPVAVHGHRAFLRSSPSGGTRLHGGGRGLYCTLCHGKPEHLRQSRHRRL